MIDFVGYKAPASKARLVGMDFLLVGLQVVMMGLVVRRKGMELISRRDVGDGGGGSRVGSSAQQQRQRQQQQQQQWRRGARDTDEQEREVFTFSSSETEGEEEEEQARDHLQPSSTSSAYTSARADYYITDYSSSSSSSSSPLPSHPPHQLQDHPLDTLHSGQYIIANIHLGETLRKEWKRYRYPAAEPSIATIV